MKCPIKPKAKLAFNKKNAAEFADQIYSESKSGIQFTKLCGEELLLRAADKASPKLHCVVGEAYATFVKNSLQSVLKEGEYKSKWNIDSNPGPTAKAIDALVDVAELRDDSLAGQQALASALDSCVTTNDDHISTLHLTGDEDTFRYMIRAKRTAKTWREEVLPLLQ